MLSMLVVDDEVIIAEGLYQMLQETFQDQLVVRRCYSAAQAQEILEKFRIDILMTDIEMPGMNGLELHRRVRDRWPMIRVIYLTGYSDFDYARQALEQNAVAYVLKSEGDQVIVAAVEKAIRYFETDHERLLHEAGSISEQSSHLRQLVFHAMHGGYLPPHQLARAIEDSGIAFAMDQPVRIAYCYFGDVVSATFMHQTMNMIDRMIRPQMPVVLTDMNAGGFSIVYQPAQETSEAALTGNIEAVQRILEHQNRRMTVCMGDQELAWSELGLGTVALLDQMNRLSPAPGELVRLGIDGTKAAKVPDPDTEFAEDRNALQCLREYLMTGQQEPFREELSRFWEQIDTSTDPQRARTLLAALTMSMNDAARLLPDSDSIGRQLAELSSYPGEKLTGFRGRLEEVARAIFSARTERQNHRQRRLVNQIDAYIDANLSGDLSLTAISDALHFHPTYISRVYKEFSGESLSDAIAQKRLTMACSMLRDSDQPISTIATETGFSTANYFARWFRKWMGCTAQEFRDKQRM